MVRSLGASPLERAITEAARSRTRDQLAAWAEDVWAGDATDPMRRRVAEEADRFLSSNESGGFRAWIEARQPFDDLEPDDDGAVSLLTFHAAKGREWSAVVVTGVEQGLVPHASALTVAQRTEEARLLYVALTRASDELTVTWALRRNDVGQRAEPVDRGLARSGSGRARACESPPPFEIVDRSSIRCSDLRAWRADVARAAGIVDRAVCSDQVLRSLLDAPPDGADELAAAPGRQRVGRRTMGTPAAQPWSDRSRISRWNTSGFIEMNSPSASAHSVSPWCSVATVKILRPSTRSTRPS